MVQSQGHGGGSLLGRILSCSVMTQSVASSSTVQYEPDGFEVQLQNDTGLVITYKGSTGTSWLNTPLEDGGTIDTGTSVTFGMKYPGCMDWNHGGMRFALGLQSSPRTERTQASSTLSSEKMVRVINGNLNEASTSFSNSGGRWSLATSKYSPLMLVWHSRRPDRWEPLASPIELRF